MKLRHAVTWSLLDQILLSGLHFALGLLVLRLSSKEGYGIYVMSWSLLLLLGGLQNAFINTQLVVRAAGLAAQEQRRTCAAFLVSQSLLYGYLLLTALLVAAVARALGATVAATVIVCVVLASGGLFLREFSRGVLLLNSDTRAVFRIDAQYAIALTLLAGACVLLPRDLLPVYAVISLGIASALAAARFCAVLRRHIGPVGQAWPYFRDSAGNGGWAGTGVIVTHVQSQSYVYLLSALAGLSTTADASAARLFLMPVSLAFSSIQRVFYPRWVVLARGNEHRSLERHARLLLLVATTAVLAYAILTLQMSGPLVAAVLGPAYSASGQYIILFAALVWAEIFRSTVSLHLQAYARFREITLCNAVSAIIVIGAGIVVIPLLGASAAILIQGAGDLLLAGLLLLVLRRHLRSHR